MNYRSYRTRPRFASVSHDPGGRRLVSLVARWRLVSRAGEKCGTCYGEGNLPTDQGVADCPDCGGAGTLPPQDTLIEWRLRQIERFHDQRSDDTSSDVKWLAFELRRARDALTELLTLADDLKDPVAGSRIRFIANRAIRMYQIVPDD